MNFNFRLFQKINSLVGKSKWLDAFGRAGAEWAIIVMLGWFGATSFLAFLPSVRASLTPILLLGAVWSVGWVLNLLIGLLVREPRPHITHSESKLLFTPLMHWKSFPSDHAMSAWLVFFMALVFSLPAAWGLMPLALWVSFGRVYAGVHYPFDIVGGLAVAGLVSMLGYYFVVILN